MLLRKLKSKAGISISVGLLIFLVCAVLGASVLAAATASSGRLAHLAEMDRRYYSISSAAELLADQLGGTEVEVMRYEKSENAASRLYNVTVTTDDAGRESTTTAFDKTQESGKKTYKTRIGATGDTLERTVEIPLHDAGTEAEGQENVPPQSPIEVVQSILSAETVYLLFGGDTCNTAEAMNRPVTRPAQANPLTCTLTQDGRTVNVTIKLRGDGILEITLDDKASGEADYYSLKLHMSPVIDDKEESESQPPETTTVKSNESVNGNRRTYRLTTTVKSTTERTRTTKVQWTVTGVEKPIKGAST